MDGPSKAGYGYTGHGSGFTRRSQGVTRVNYTTYVETFADADD